MTMSEHKIFGMTVIEDKDMPRGYVRLIPPPEPGGPRFKLTASGRRFTLLSCDMWLRHATVQFDDGEICHDLTMQDIRDNAVYVPRD